MPIELSKETREEAIVSIQSYSSTNLDETLGNIAAGALLDFFLEEIGPSVYNKALADAQERIHARLAELDVELLLEEFPYWRRRAPRD